MPAPSFVHLRLHTEFSITDGMVRIDDAVARAAADGMGALAVTDLANLFGMVKFYKAARAAGVKPIIGADVWIANEAERDRPSRLLLLARNRAGYLRLCELLSDAWLKNQHRGRAEIARAWLADGGGEGLIALSGGPAGEVGQALAAGNAAAAERLAREWAAFFPDAFYLEVQRAGGREAAALADATVALAGRTGLPVVATHPVQFLKREEFTAHEARVCIAEGYILSDQRRPRAFTPDCYFKTQAEMAGLFADLPEALANAVEIAKRCNFVLELGRSKLPAFPTPAGTSLDEYLVRSAEAGLARRLERLYPDPAVRAREAPRYRERLAFEASTISQMGFAGYFLIVADFINWAKTNGVPVGPGRGSGAGSLVAYALGITDLDPLAYDLLFERFLNPERVSMPDFDIDFCQDGRDRVIDYVRRKYGAESVSQIATFGTMAAKAVVRDVGRVMDWGYGRTDELAKLIPFQPGKLITLAMAREMEPRLKEREENEEDTRALLALAEQLEGLTRNVGMHAGGVLIAPGKLTDFCPLYAAPGTESVVSQLDKDDVEAIGLVKFDFLGLTTLTILDWTLRFVKRLDPASTLSLESLPLDDRDAYRVFATANTTAVFQFESPGMRKMLVAAKPDRFEDLIALVALSRPGPMALIPDFIERKHGRKPVVYPDPRLEPILAQTYGIMVYQEQVMQIAQVIGGYTLGAADLLRRAMGKKKPEEMAQHREVFAAGAAKNGLARERANQLFDLMEKFAGYGFNKSHAAAYALVAYQTAYMKAHHAAAFMAANLSAVMDDTDKVRAFHDDARANGLAILPPDINASEYRFVPVDARTIRYGLGAVKGTGEAAIATILRARESGGPFADLFDFCRRVDKRLVNRRAIEALVRAGAFDGLGPHRASLLASVGRAMEAAEQAERDAQQASLFGGADAPAVERLALVACEPWDERQRLAEEKAALGFYYSGHPFAAYRAEIQHFCRTTLARVVPTAGSGEDGTRTVLLAGIVDAIRWQRTATGRMLILTLGDGTATQEVTVYSEVFDQCRNVVREDAVLVVEAKIRQFRRSGGEEGGEDTFTRITAERVYDLAAARARYARGLRLCMNGEVSGARAPAGAQKLRQLLAPYRDGPLPVQIRYRTADAECEVRLGDEWRVRPDDALLDSLTEWLRPGNVEVVYA
ncbi:MAG: DNA polymerase III subunit alpha [Burkholderiales bacterium]|nr:DNA polymerase III subunit alpha [Burkholderiales bacterium]